MSMRFTCSTILYAPINAVFDLSLSIDVHIESMDRFDEHAVAGVTTGQIGLGDDVTWTARHFGLSWTMTSQIAELRRPEWFVDVQTEGPFRSFRHEHNFEAITGATVMTDDVTLSAPLGPLGAAIEFLVLKRKVKTLIDNRNAAIKQTAERGNYT